MPRLCQVPGPVKPPLGVGQIDRAGIGRDMVGLWLFNETGGPPINYAQNDFERSTLTGTRIDGGDFGGPSRRMTASTSRVDTNYAYPTLDVWSVWCVFRLFGDGFGAVTSGAVWGDSAGGDWSFGCDGADNLSILTINGSSPYTGTDLGVNSGRVNHVAVTADGSKAYTYVNGVLRRTDSLTTTVNVGGSGTLEFWWGRDALAGTVDARFEYGGIWTRCLDHKEIDRLYENPLAVLLPWRRRPLGRRSGGAATYTASAALTVGAATLSGGATHTPPTYTGSAAVSAGPATLSASGTFATATYTASAALSAGPAALSGSATHTPPTYAGAAAVTAGAATLAGSAAHTPPTYTGSAAVSAGPAALSGAAAFTAPTYAASAALSAGPAALSASATFAAPTYSASAALSAGAVILAGAGVFSRTGALVLLYGRLRADVSPAGSLRADVSPAGTLRGDVSPAGTLRGDAARSGALRAATSLSGSLGGRSMSIRQSYECNRGEDVTLTLNHASGANMTGWALAFEFLAGAFDSGTVVFRRTTSAGITIGDDGTSTGARATVTLTAANLDVDAGTYYWTLSRTDSGSKTVLAHGPWEVRDVGVGSAS